jgi:surface carbohydrate biosynthesis protein
LNKILYLPIEFASRELNSKLLLALYFSQKGFKVLIGQQWALYANANLLPKGIFFFKGVNNFNIELISKIKNLGHFTCLLEEELFSISEKEGFLNYPNPSSEVIDLIFSSSHNENKFRISNGRDELNCYPSGNPRLDLLKNKFRYFYDHKIKEIKKIYGKYLLINTNFGLNHSMWGSIEHAFAIHMNSAPKEKRSSKEYIDKFYNFLEWETACINAIKEFLQIAITNNNINIILRPHPAENLKKATQIWHSISNKINVIRDGEHIPWTMGATALLHTSCTTGFEAAAANIPSVSIVPYKTWYTESIISNKVNHVSSTAEEAYQIINEAIEKNHGLQIKNHAMHDFVPNYPQKFAFIEIFNKLNSLQFYPPQPNVIFPNFSNLPERSQIFKEKITLSKTEIEYKINLLHTDFPEKGMLPKVNELGDSLFLLHV